MAVGAAESCANVEASVYRAAPSASP